jgi:hypothetical protein
VDRVEFEMMPFAARHERGRDRFDFEDEFRPASLPPSVREAFGMGALVWPFAVQRAVIAGVSNLDDLTNIVFYMHHPERIRAGAGLALSPGEPGFDKLRNEWKAFRTLIGPMIKYVAKPAAPASGAKSPAPGGASTPGNPDDQMFQELRRALDWMNGQVGYAAEKCLADKLLRPDVDDGFVDASRMSSFFKDDPRPLHPVYFSNAKTSVKTRLRTRREFAGTVTVADVVTLLQGIAQHVVQGMNVAYFQLTGADIYDARRKAEVKRELGSRVNQSASLYHCRFARDRYGESIATLS